MTRYEAMQRISSTLLDGQALKVWVAHKNIKGRHMAISVDGADCYEITSDGYKWIGHKWRHGGDLLWHYHRLVVESRMRA